MQQTSGAAFARLRRNPLLLRPHRRTTSRPLTPQRAEQEKRRGPTPRRFSVSISTPKRKKLSRLPAAAAQLDQEIKDPPHAAVGIRLPPGPLPTIIGQSTSGTIRHDRLGPN